MTPETLGRYTLLEHLGSGRVTETFRASATSIEGFERSVVVKRLLPAFRDDPDLDDCLLTTLRPTVALSHANIAQILDVSTRNSPGDGRYWTTQHVSGWALGTLLSRQEGRALPIELVLYLGLEVSKALDYAHRLQSDPVLVHGNLSANNLLISREGEVKVTDFGVALSLRRRESPGASATPQDDLRQLATILYQGLTNQLSPAAASIERPLRALRPELPTSVTSLLHKILRNDAVIDAAELHEQLLQAVVSERLRWSRSNVVEWLNRSFETGAEPPLPSFELESATQSEPKGASELIPASLLVLTPRAALSQAVSAQLGALLQRAPHDIHWLPAGQLCVVFQQTDGRDVELAVRFGLALLRALGPAAKGTDIAVDLANLDATQFDPISSRFTPQAVAEAALPLSAPQWNSPGRVIVSLRATRELRSLFRLKRAHDLGFAVVGSRSIEQASGPFHGRGQDLEWLAQRLSDVKLHGAIAIVGSTGLGKTRLMLELGKYLRKQNQEAKLCVASCPVRGQLSPYSAILALLARVCEIREGDAVPRSLQRERVLAQVDAVDLQRVQNLLAEGIAPGPSLDLELLGLLTRIVAARTRRRPHILVLDGAHHIDATSRILLHGVEQALGERAALVLLTRDDLLPTQLALPVDRVHRLEPLDETTMEQLMASRLQVSDLPRDLAQHFAALAMGNPFILEELLREALAQGQITLGRRKIKQYDLAMRIEPSRSLKLMGVPSAPVNPPT